MSLRHVAFRRSRSFWSWDDQVCVSDLAIPLVPASHLPPLRFGFVCAMTLQCAYASILLEVCRIQILRQNPLWAHWMDLGLQDLRSFGSLANLFLYHRSNRALINYACRFVITYDVVQRWSWSEFRKGVGSDNWLVKGPRNWTAACRLMAKYRRKGVDLNVEGHFFCHGNFQHHRWA